MRWSAQEGRCIIKCGAVKIRARREPPVSVVEDGGVVDLLYSGLAADLANRARGSFM